MLYQNERDNLVSSQVNNVPSVDAYSLPSQIYMTSSLTSIL
jgi:hypothetical protein